MPKRSPPKDKARMIPKKKEEDWFGLSDDEDNDGSGSEVDDREESRTSGVSSRERRGAKRRKVGHHHSSDYDEDEDGSGEESVSEGSRSEDEDDDAEDGDEEGRSDNGIGKASDDEQEWEEIEEDEKKATKKGPAKTELKTLTPAQLAQSRLATKKTGIIYLSRIPPYMKPHKVKHLLSRFGTIGRIFLTPEDPTSHSRRVKFGGNKKLNFTEGWVEFMDKKVAKAVAETLNATILGGKKGSYYHDDVWNMKYLKGFKWHHLQAQIGERINLVSLLLNTSLTNTRKKAYENASRQAKLRTEVSQATRENKAFIRNVEKAKMLENMQASRKRKADAATSTSTSTSTQKVQDGGSVDVEVRRQFRQNKAMGQKANMEEGIKSSDAVNKVLRSIL